jgi:hypothetical protein
VFDRDDQLTICVDGATCVTKNISSLSDLNFDNTTSTFVMGRNTASNSGNSLTGNLDEVRIWDTALDNETVSAWHNQELTNSHPNISDLQVYYKFNDDSAEDLTADYLGGHASDGTVTGATYTNSDNSGFTTNTDASLPVELTSFTASSLKGAVQLSWVTESEIDNLGFLVDRSLEPISGFTTIADYRFVPELQGQGSVTYRTDYSYKDTEVIPGTKYYYVLSDVTGNPEYGEPVTRHTDKMVNATPLWADLETGILKDFRLLKVYPNPFNPSTMISFDVPLDTKHATLLRVYNIKGQLVETLVNEQMKPGTHKIKWNAVNLSSGIYFVEMRAGDKIFNQKITFIK